MAKDKNNIVEIKNEIKTEEKSQKEEVVAAGADFFTVFLKDYSLNILYLIEHQKVLNALQSNLLAIKQTDFKAMMNTHLTMSREMFKKIVDNMLVQKSALEKVREEWLKQQPKKTDIK